MRNVLVVLGLVVSSAFALAVHAADSQPAPSASAATPSAYTTEDSPLGDILDDADAAAVIDKHVPGFSKNPDVEMARTMTLRQIQQYAGDTFTDDILSSIDADFAALAAQRKAK